MLNKLLFFDKRIFDLIAGFCATESKNYAFLITESVNTMCEKFKSFHFLIVFFIPHIIQFRGENILLAALMIYMILILLITDFSAGCDGSFIELHNDVKIAKSDIAI